MRIRAWYTGRRTYRVSSAAVWSELPATGALAFVRFRDLGRERVTAGEWYWLDDRGELRRVPSRAWGERPDPPPGIELALLKRGDRAGPEEWARVLRESWEATWH